MRRLSGTPRPDRPDTRLTGFTNAPYFRRPSALSTSDAREALGGPGPLPTQGSHGPGRAGFRHPVRQVTVSLREVELSVRLAVLVTGTPLAPAASIPNSAVLHMSDGATI